MSDTTLLDSAMRGLHGAIASNTPEGLYIACLVGDPATGHVRVIRNCDSECMTAMLEDVLAKEPALTETLSQ